MTRAPSLPLARRVLLTLLLALPAACHPGPVHRWADGRIVARGAMERHEHEGPWTLFDEQGRRFATGCYRRGQPTGIWKAFHADTGTLRERLTFVDGALTGPAATWFRDGQRESAGAFVAGQRDGAWWFWRADGTVDLQRTGWYRAGARSE